MGRETDMMIPIRLIQTEWPPNIGVMSGNERFDHIFESIKEMGIQEPLTINLKWQIIDGNHRLAAAKILDIQMVPVKVWTGTEYIE
jgi:ParB-like chromosome segregation protein Spo0J